MVNMTFSLAAVQIMICYIVFFKVLFAEGINNPNTGQNRSREQIITHYFLAGFCYVEILHFLSSFHGIEICLRQLNRLLRRYGLHRRGHSSSTNDVLLFIQSELEGSGSSYGYRVMHQNLRSQGFNVDRETVRVALKSLDPEGVILRSRRRLRRRIYRSMGPNYVWHVDGYDKLKPYGFAIHGAIDGYSRKILWLRAGKTNNDPKIIASYFYNFVKQERISPRLIRTDRGSENIILGGIQRFLRRSNHSFRFGQSVTNQRIESWWSIFRRNRMNWWINFFKDMIDEDLLDPSIAYHRECLRFCFIGLLQSEIDETVKLWNNHRIRYNRNSVAPGGRPDALFYIPEQYGAYNFNYPVSDADLEEAKTLCLFPSAFECSSEFLELAILIMSERQLKMPFSIPEAKNLFLCIIREIDM